MEIPTNRIDLGISFYYSKAFDLLDMSFSQAFYPKKFASNAAFIVTGIL
jgi:hypothetical protein